MGTSGFGSMTITQAGLNLLAKTQAGTALEFTRIAVGDGSLGAQDPTALTGLIDQIATFGIETEVAQGKGQATIGTTMSNAGLSAAFYWREIGIFAQDPQLGEILYGYDNAGNNASYISAPSSGPYSAALSIVTYVGSSSSVTVTLSPNVAASDTTPGIVELTVKPTGTPVVPVRMAECGDTAITGTAAQTLLSLTVPAGNYEARVYLRVNRKTKITVAVSYTDGTGAQTQYIMPRRDGLYFPLSGGAQPYEAGSYPMPALFFCADAGNVTVTVTAEDAGAVFAAAAVVGV